MGVFTHEPTYSGYSIVTGRIADVLSPTLPGFELTGALIRKAVWVLHAASLPLVVLTVVLGSVPPPILPIFQLNFELAIL